MRVRIVARVPRAARGASERNRMAFTTSFHWSAPSARTCEPARFVDVCRRAASAGFESVDIPHAPSIAEAIALAAAAAGAIRDLRFRVTCAPPASLGKALADERMKDRLKD